MAEVRNRPLSPHIGIWRWRLHMLLSISHRGTGMVNTVAAVCLVWWLVALASGPEDYARFVSSVESWFGRLVLFGFTLSFMLHMATGIRHLIMDTGAGLEIGQNKRLNRTVVAAAIVATILVWVLGYWSAGEF
ncbi:MAG: succinate dehydrogenase, cytochrome b556 subunit [Rhodothalassiaceae bacterium]